MNLQTNQNAGAGARRLESLASGVAIMLALTIVQRGVGFLRSIAFCRWLDADQLGTFDLAFNFLMLAAPLAVLGLPGSFGRYVEYFRERGQLRAFLARATLLSGILAALTIGAIFCFPAQASWWVFGQIDSGQMILLMAATLGSVIAFNFLTSLLNALRMYRVNSLMQLAQTVVFAGLSVGLIYACHTGAASAIAAFGVASLITSLGASIVVWRVWRELPTASEALSFRSLTVKIAPFAFWLWVTNWVYNSFELVDRWMIVHYSGLEPGVALELVGQYHSARVLPVLLIGVGDLLGNMLTPHLSAEWEAGRREQVAARLNFVFKLTGIGFTLAAVSVLWFSPVLFHLALKHKFAGGESILSWALACAVWTALTTIVCNYLWCAERSRWVSLAFALALAICAVTNFVLLPHFGLLGAAWANTFAKLCALGLMLAFARAFGMQFDRRTLPVIALPLLLPLGGIATFVATALVACGIGPIESCFTTDERRQLRDFATRITRRLPVIRRWSSTASS